MNELKQQHEKTSDTAPVVSPLVNEKTYGERWYSRTFDWGLNYWANLLTSAGFSQWAEHGNGEFTVPFLNKKTTPQKMQSDFAKRIANKDPLMTGNIPFTDAKIPFYTGYQVKAKAEAQEIVNKCREIPGYFNAGEGNAILTEVEKVAQVAQNLINDRSMARARSLTLLAPGAFIVIPTVWIGAKIKPWFVETLNRHHYGDEAMNDTTLQARHQALEAEARPTFMGAVTARIATMFAAQFVAQAVGSKGNLVNQLGEKNAFLKDFGVNEITKKAGFSLGSALPQKTQDNFSAYTRSKIGLDWSEEQIKDHLKVVGHIHEDSVEPLSEDMINWAKQGFKNGATQKIGNHTPSKKITELDEKGRHDLAVKGLGEYSKATQDLGRFIAADTFYTMVTKVTIDPAIHLLRMIPGMSYKPKAARNSAHFEGQTVKMPVQVKVPVNQFGDFMDREPSSEPAANAPTYSISQATSQGPLQQRELQVANG